MGGSGIDAAPAASAIAATTVLSLGTLFALPIVTLSFALVGAPAPSSLVYVALGGAVLFLVLFGLGALFMSTDRPLRVIGRHVERLIGHRGKLHLTAAGIEDERDRLRETLGSRWRGALAFSAAIWGFDYLSLVAVLVALHTTPQLSLVLLAFTAAKILGMVPITPGGLGIVEAGLTGMLTLAGIPAGAALLATLAYRLASYWLTLPAGIAAWILYRHRYPTVDVSSQPRALVNHRARS